MPKISSLDKVLSLGYRPHPRRIYRRISSAVTGTWSILIRKCRWHNKDSTMEADRNMKTLIVTCIV